MTLVACGLLALGVLAFMISPMLEGSARRPWAARAARSAWSAWSTRSRRDELLKKKDFIYSSLRELNIDYNMGKLAAEDHDALHREYMSEASEVLDELDRTAGSDLPVEEQIEEAVLEIRRRRGPETGLVADVTETGLVADVTDPALDYADESAVDPASEDREADDGRHAQRAAGLTCVKCGTVNDESANFCIECGASLKRITCSGCGTENPAAARFCGQCGVKLI